LANVRFGADSGLKSDIASRPKSAISGIATLSRNSGFWATIIIARVGEVNTPGIRLNQIRNEHDVAPADGHISSLSGAEIRARARLRW
jgi:hypothetical protein